VPRPRLLVLNQYYWPGIEATANLLADLCEALATQYDVTVVAGASPGQPHRTERNGVAIVRVRSTAFDRTMLSRRAANYLTYVVGAVRAAFVSQRPDVIMCMTDPPFIGAAAQLVARRFRVPLVAVVQDVFPEIAVKLGRIRNPVAIAVLGNLIVSSLNFADRVVVIGETMRLRIEAKGVEPSRIRVIPNWGDTDGIVPRPQDNSWAGEHCLTGRFVVMHSGNVGHAQALDSLVRATTLLRDLDDLRVPIIGTGARYAQLTELASTLEADAVEFLPYQAREQLSLSLSSAHVHYVGLARGLAGYIVPSRMWGVLAAGRPVIAAAEEESETAQVVRSAGCGLVVRPGDPLALAVAIRECHEGRHDLEAMGRRARAFAERESERSIAVDRYRRVLDEVRAIRH